MFLNSLHFLIVICLTTQALRVAVLSQTLDSKFPLLDVLAGIPSKAWSPIRARIQPAAAAAATGGITNNAQQSQNVTNTAGMNGTDPLPGLITNPTYESPMINCSDLSTGRDNKCWSDLNLTRWVEMWVEVNPCYQNEAFASCFLRKEGFPGLDCTGIKVSSCTSPNVAGMDPITFYVAYNIYAINQFFLSWYTAVGSSAAIASNNVDIIVQLLDPPSDTNLILDDILIALTGIFAVAPGLGFGAATLTNAIKGISDGFKTGAQTVENALLALPQIGRFLFPIDSSSSQIIQVAQLKAKLGSLIGTVQGNLNKTLVSVMSNSSEFLVFASQGNFTASAPSLPDEENYLLYAFNTYIISAGLAGNNVFGVVSKDTNVRDLATNATSKSLNYDLSACKSYNDQNVCDAFWYSEKYNSTFTLDDFSHMNRNYGPTLTKLFQNYTTGQLLFDSGYACNTAGNYGQPVNVTINAAGVNTACLSQFRIVSWDMSCHDPTKHQCEFAEIKAQPQMYGTCGSHSIFSVMDDPIHCVPYGYLGPLVTQTSHKLRRS